MRKRQRVKRIGALFLLFSLVFTACSDDDDQSNGAQPQNGNQDQADSTLKEVKRKGKLTCGTEGSVPGFSTVNSDGDHEGFDVDFCKAIAAAVLGDPEKVEYRELTASNRFTLLQASEVDVLIRNTTWTAKRDGAESGNFAATTFYDSQGIMVHTGEFKTVEDLDNSSICLISGTTTEANIAAYFAAKNLKFDPRSYENSDSAQEAFQSGSCDAWSADRSRLVGVQKNWLPEPGALTILDDVLSKEPLGPVTRDGDTQWSDIVNWVVFATINAEELGITQENVDDMIAGSKDSEVQRFLGIEVDGTIFNPKLGLPTDFNAQVIRAVGNYSEIYKRNIGHSGLERGLNNLWTAEPRGLLYSPPYI